MSEDLAIALFGEFSINEQFTLHHWSGIGIVLNSEKLISYIRFDGKRADFHCSIWGYECIISLNFHVMVHMADFKGF